MARRKIDPNSLRRRPAFREPKRRILVLCEGERTEPLYLKELSRVYRSLVGRAEGLDLQCERDGEPCRNPSTGVYRLVLRIAREGGKRP